ncbi:hypothetical protein [Agromyces aureus]|uniref:hypothetical protein n=1 Tax=Agromyces aureus TaxID=453304 RepID=UPI000B18D11D|nr:hypothetical protein [Agromyces aureus]
MTDPTNDEIQLPGAPAASPSDFDLTADPCDPFTPKPDQRGPDRRTPSRAGTDVEAAALAQLGVFLAPAHRMCARSGSVA